MKGIVTEISRLRGGFELPAYPPPPTKWDPSLVCDLCHRSQKCWIINPLSKAITFKKKERKKKQNKIVSVGVPIVAQWVKNPTSIQEDSILIPGLAVQKY